LHLGYENKLGVKISRVHGRIYIVEPTDAESNYLIYCSIKKIVIEQGVNYFIRKRDNYYLKIASFAI